MPEMPVEISCGELSLEAMFSEGSRPGGNGALLCHPHPLYGGSMDNNVVIALRDVMAKWGWGTLRFNFRGVGRSQGEYCEGDGEADDLLAAAGFLRDRGMERIHVGAYSFGAWVALKTLARGFCPASMVLVSPPMDFLDFRGLQPPESPCLITLGDRDSFASAETVRTWAGSQGCTSNLEFAELPQCDHFYWNREGQLATKVASFLQSHFPNPH